MNQDQSPPMSPEDRARFQSAAIQEQDAQMKFLQGRLVSLNVEVQMRDAALAEERQRVEQLSAELTDLRAQQSLAAPGGGDDEGTH